MGLIKIAILVACIVGVLAIGYVGYKTALIPGEIDSCIATKKELLTTPPAKASTDPNCAPTKQSQ